jgi:hypothetical protein
MPSTFWQENAVFRKKANKEIFPFPQKSSAHIARKNIRTERIPTSPQAEEAKKEMNVHEAKKVRKKHMKTKGKRFEPP